MDGSARTHSEHGGGLQSKHGSVSVSGVPSEGVTALTVLDAQGGGVVLALDGEEAEHLVTCLLRANPGRAFNAAFAQADNALVRAVLGPPTFTPKTLPPQSKQVLRYMKKYTVVTPMKAMHELGVQSLSRRICDLRAAGYNVRRELRKDFRGKRYATYSLEETRDVPAAG